MFTPKSESWRCRAARRGGLAYAEVHSDVGDRTVAAKVNGEAVALRTELRSGDVVEIVTGARCPPQPGLAELVAPGRRIEDPPPFETMNRATRAPWARRYWPRRCAPKG